jgi:hypothetical protein
MAEHDDESQRAGLHENEVVAATIPDSCPVQSAVPGSIRRARPARHREGTR